MHTMLRPTENNRKHFTLWLGIGLVVLMWANPPRTTFSDSHMAQSLVPVQHQVLHSHSRHERSDNAPGARLVIARLGSQLLAVGLVMLLVAASQSASNYGRFCLLSSICTVFILTLQADSSVGGFWTGSLVDLSYLFI